MNIGPLPGFTGMANGESRETQKVTVLEKKSGSWTDREIQRIAGATCHGVTNWSKCPTFLLLPNTPSRELIASVLDIDFDLNVITGMDNSELPFIPVIL